MLLSAFHDLLHVSQATGLPRLSTQFSMMVLNAVFDDAANTFGNILNSSASQLNPPSPIAG